MTTSSSVELGAEDGTSRRRTSVHNNQSSTLAPETIDGLNIARARLARCDLELEEIEDKERKIIQIHVIGRILFTVLSLSLLWMCSLPVINYIVDLVLVHPPSDELSRDWGALIDVGVSQTSSYKTCLQEVSLYANETWSTCSHFTALHLLQLKLFLGTQPMSGIFNSRTRTTSRFVCANGGEHQSNSQPCTKQEH